MLLAGLAGMRIPDGFGHWFGSASGAEFQSFIESIPDSIVSGARVLVVGTGSSEEQFLDWARLFDAAGAGNIEYLEYSREYVDKWAFSGATIHYGSIVDIESIFKPGDFDIIVFSQGIEHLTYDDMITAVTACERIASRMVLFTCPFGSAYDYQGCQVDCPGGESHAECHKQKAMTPETLSCFTPLFSVRTFGQKDSPSAHMALYRYKPPHGGMEVANGLPVRQVS